MGHAGDQVGALGRLGLGASHAPASAHALHASAHAPWSRRVYGATHPPPIGLGCSYCRLHRGQSHAELEWTVGPIPFEDGLGREVVLLVRLTRRGQHCCRQQDCFGSTFLGAFRSAVGLAPLPAGLSAHMHARFCPHTHIHTSLHSTRAISRAGMSSGQMQMGAR